MTLKDKVMANDLRVLDVASYVASKGQLLDLKNASPEKQEEFFEKITQLFKEFKARVRKGSWTLDQLEEEMYGKFGILEDPPITDPGKMTLEDILKGNINKKYPPLEDKGRGSIGFQS